MSGAVAASNSLSVQGLATSDVVGVTVSLSPSAIPLQNFGAFMIIGPSPKIIDTNERFRQYTNIAGVIQDFGTSAPEYLAAVLFFEQSPQPAILYIGRWAQAATGASIHGGTLSATNTLVSTWVAVGSAGSMQITVDGVVKTLANLSFGSVTNLNAVASVIQTALAGQITCIYNATYNRFEVYSGTTGAASTISYATPTGSGTDISAMLGLSLAGGASPPCSPGIVAETPLAALSLIAQYSVWYGGMFAPTNYGDITDAQYVACAALIQASRRVFCFTTMEPAALVPTQSTDLGSQLKAAKYNRSFVQYSSSNPYAAASAFARGFTVDFQGNNTTITLKFKIEPGITAETLNETQAASLASKGTNVFVNYTNGAAIIQEGVMADGTTYFDTLVGIDWLQNQIQTDVFNLLYTAPTKIPQTDPGMHQIMTTIDGSLQIGVGNGLIAPGQWNAPGFGQIDNGTWLPKGYYIYCPPIATQSQATRAQRIAVPMQVAVKLGGAVHSANVSISVNP